MKTAIIKVRLPNDADPSALNITHNVKPTPIHCFYEVITPPTREEIRQAAQGEADFESFMDGANWAIYKILNQKP